MAQHEIHELSKHDNEPTNSLSDILTANRLNTYGESRLHLLAEAIADRKQHQAPASKMPDETEIFKFFLNKKPSQEKCDRRPQIPDFGNFTDTCGIDIKGIYDSVNVSTAKVFDDIPFAAPGDSETHGSSVFACSSDGTFCGAVTNEHVAKDLYGGNAKLVRDEAVSYGKVVAHDTLHDLALIELNQDPTASASEIANKKAGSASSGKDSPKPEAIEFTPVTFASQVHTGEPLVSVCYPTNILSNAFVAIGRTTNVSANERVSYSDKTVRTLRDTISTEQVIFPGCSGGGNFNTSSEFVGTTTAASFNSYSSGEAVTVNARYAIELLNRYSREKKAKQNPAM